MELVSVRRDSFLTTLPDLVVVYMYTHVHVHVQWSNKTLYAFDCVYIRNYMYT